MDEKIKILMIASEDDFSDYIKDALELNDEFILHFESFLEGGLSALKHGVFDVLIVNPGIPADPYADFIRELKKADPEAVIIAFLGDNESSKMAALANLGVYDFITKPLNLENLFLLIRKAGQFHHALTLSNKQIRSLKEQNNALAKQNLLLAGRIEDSAKSLSRLYEALRSTYLRTIKVLAQTIDARDHYTHSHSENVAKYAVAIAEDLALSAKEVENIREACELHDLGKIGVEDNILSKPSGLTALEWEQIKLHPVIGAKILEPLTFLGDVIDLVKQHHEHYNGTGYPEGIKLDNILLGARIIHVADAYEAMRSVRPYRKHTFSKEEAVAEIERNAGIQFDPEVVKAFLRVVDKL
ncbi:MAG: HD domain-containing phosphohydrolase [Candidatus Omnitrophota bacterium]